MPQLPIYLSILFLVTALATALLFLKATDWDRRVALVLIAWAAIQTALGLSGFYTHTNNTPPRFMLLVGPPMVLILTLLLTTKGRTFLAGLDLRWLTLIHVVRLPVEIGLYMLMLHHWIPELMSFEGRNPDILSGLTAIPVFLLAFRNGRINRSILILWNVLALGLVFNIVINGMLSAPSPFQQFAFEQPNIAVLHYPFNLLPSMIVPMVILSHIASLTQLFKNKEQ